MLTSSSPTVSAPNSPSATFHAHARYASASSRRTSASSRAPSPRVPAAVSASSRRLEHSHPHAYTQPATSAPSPVPAFAHSPQQHRRREYTHTGTQYTPPGLPPTYRAPAETAAAPALPQTSIPLSARGETSAESAVTEPPAPSLRKEPQSAVSVPVLPSQPNTRPPSRDEGSHHGQQQRPRQDEPSPAAPEALSSPSKRARTQPADVKVMPLKYETCDVKDLGVLISDMLMELVRLNDGFPLRDGQLTRFHSRAPPGISVRDYLFRLIVHATLSPPILLSMVFYVDKLCTMYPAFTISSLTVHRFLITAATVAAKGLSDSFWTNSLYARVGGVSVRELALLELEFLHQLEWRIVPKPETLVDYYKGLVERGDGYTIEKPPEPASSPSLAPSESTAQTGQPESSAMGAEAPQSTNA
ncbi:cyclin-domain-containing protein [Massariosphaeria phaeospora]|uniref:Cyclin-domain-containing protein n=1 Tax=Massariosphaeria phaeospora TaxID=100035 RepID=A0A7C8MHA9_9PLEO|nr:cyclin-domain-containing protein [Massariosphaeria phaeospora]